MFQWRLGIVKYVERYVSAGNYLFIVLNNLLNNLFTYASLILYALELHIVYYAHTAVFHVCCDYYSNLEH